MNAPVIEIRWDYQQGAYKVSVPRWDGGKVVSLEDYNTVCEQLIHARDKVSTATLRMCALERRIDHYRDENMALKRVGSTTLTAGDLEAIREWYKERQANNTR
jgi:hypothetical protein